jgi:hypothetical protein
MKKKKKTKKKTKKKKKKRKKKSSFCGEKDQSNAIGKENLDNGLFGTIKR